MANDLNDVAFDSWSMSMSMGFVDSTPWRISRFLTAAVVNTPVEPDFFFYLDN